MVIVPTARIPSAVIAGPPDYHMHLGEGVAEAEDDGLPRYDGRPEDPHMALLVEACS